MVTCQLQREAGARPTVATHLNQVGTPPRIPAAGRGARRSKYGDWAGDDLCAWRTWQQWNEKWLSEMASICSLSSTIGETVRWTRRELSGPGKSLRASARDVPELASWVLRPRNLQ